MEEEKLLVREEAGKERGTGQAHSKGEEGDSHGIPATLACCVVHIVLWWSYILAAGGYKDNRLTARWGARILK